MILYLGRKPSWEHRYFICLEHSVDEKTFLRRAKAKPGTYAGELVTNLYEAIFYRSVELKTDYTKYYALEYATFGEYLRKRLLVPIEIIDHVASEFSKSRQIIYFNPVYSFLDEDYGREFLERLLERKSVK